MSKSEKIPLELATSIADELIYQLRPGCNRIMVAGSIRRRRPMVGDIELVAIPRINKITDMFGNLVEDKNYLLPLLERYPKPFPKNGPKQKQIDLGDVMLDLYITDFDRWPVIYTLRTGSAEFSHWLVKHKRHGGALPWGMTIHKGYLWKDNKIVPLLNERDLFDAIGLPWVEPEDRQDYKWLDIISKEWKHG